MPVDSDQQWTRQFQRQRFHALYARQFCPARGEHHRPNYRREEQSVDDERTLYYQVRRYELHSLYIEVNEKGAEMASVSVAGMDMNAAGPIEIKERNLQFFADHPFVYIVSETSTGAVFFIGTYQGKN